MPDLLRLGRLAEAEFFEVDGTVYRHDNIPHIRWRGVASFPKHYHNGAQQNVTESDISENPEQGLRQFLQFAAGVIAGLR